MVWGLGSSLGLRAWDGLGFRVQGLGQACLGAQACG